MTPQQVLQDAFNLFQRGQLDQAAPLFQWLIDADPRNYRALHLLGVLRAQQGNPAMAIDLIGKALKIEPGDFGAHMNYGLALAAAGRHRDAVVSYERALILKPDFHQAHYNRSVALMSLGRFQDATSGFDAALGLQPHNVHYLYNKGLALAAMGKPQEALALYEAALARDAKFAPAWDSHGNALAALGRHEQSLASYDKALALQPDAFQTHYNRATILANMQRHQEAIAGYDAALSFNRQFADAWTNRGNALAAQGQFAESVGNFDAALAIRPGDVAALNSKAAALRQAGDPAQSVALCDQILAKHPASVAALMTRAWALFEATRYPEALAAFDRLLAAEPGSAEAWNGRGATLHAMNRDEEALPSFDHALELKPDFPDALNNRALLAWMFKGNYDIAVADLTRSVATLPDQAFVQGELLHLKMQGADWSGFEQHALQLDAGIEAGKPVVRPFVYQAISASPENLQKCSRLFADKFFRARPAPAFAPRQHKKIRLGYVSGEFKEQATAYLMAGLYEQHDREKFEVIAIDNTGPDASAMRQRLEAAFDRMIDITQLNDDEAASRIRDEEIDILINLNGYFGAPRMGLFARRAAPVQVNYLGFPATLGASCMDYIIADRIVIPEEEKQFYDEKVVWLPNSYQANDNKRGIAPISPSRASAGLPEKGFVFCNFNQSYKLTPETFASWMRILGKTPGSVLWLLESGGPFMKNLREAAARHGVDGARLVFAPMVKLEEHLARLKCADLFVDALPYNAHTTASDALWAGVPLLTCLGTAFPGRVAASLLHAIGLPELVTQTRAQYDELAIRLAADPAALTALRRKLETHRASHPLFDTALFRTHIEAAYAKMWDRLQNGHVPDSFAVS